VGNGGGMGAGFVLDGWTRWGVDVKEIWRNLEIRPDWQDRRRYQWMKGMKLNCLLYTSHRPLIAYKDSTAQYSEREAGHFSTYEETNQKSHCWQGVQGEYWDQFLLFQGTTNGMHAFERYHVILFLLCEE
jgi:hypothetical protein